MYPYYSSSFLLTAFTIPPPRPIPTVDVAVVLYFGLATVEPVDVCLAELD